MLIHAQLSKRFGFHLELFHPVFAGGSTEWTFNNGCQLFRIAYWAGKGAHLSAPNHEWKLTWGNPVSAYDPRARRLEYQHKKDRTYWRRWIQSPIGRETNFTRKQK